MKKFAILLALLLFQTQLIAGAATTNTTYNKQPAKKTQQQVKPVSQQSKQVKPTNNSNDDYLLKYNIDDLEAAPWLNGGKRKI